MQLAVCAVLLHRLWPCLPQFDTGWLPSAAVPLAAAAAPIAAAVQPVAAAVAEVAPPAAVVAAARCSLRFGSPRKPETP